METIAGVLIGLLAGVVGMAIWQRQSARPPLPKPAEPPGDQTLLRRLRQSLEISGVGSWEWDPISNEVWWSEEHYRLFGVTPTTFTPTYDSYMAMVHPEDRPSVQEQTGSVLEGADWYGQDYRIIRPDGSILWVQSRGSATRDRTGRLILLTGTDQEITKRKQIESALRENEEKFRAIFDQTFEFIGLMSTDGILVHANRSAVEATGVVESDVVGRHFADTIWWTHDPVQQDRLREAIVRAARGEMVRFESNYLNTTGDLVWVDFSLKPYRDTSGVVRWLIPEGRDISERRQTEQELRVSRERFEVAVAGSRDGIWDWDVTANTVYFSARWKEMLGYREDELSNEFRTWEELLHPGDRRESVDALNSYFQGLLPIYQVEFRMRAKNGEWRWILSRASLSRDGEGRPIRMAGSHTDITDRRREADELAANKALLVQFIKHAPAAIAMLDKDMRYVRASDRWLTDYRLNDSSIIGRSHYEVFPELPEHWRAIHPRVLAGAVESREEDQFPRGDGTTDWLQWEARPWRKSDGEIGGLIFFTQVITERRRVELELRESEERYRSVVESLAEGVIVQDSDGAILASNHRAEEILGLTKEQIAGRSSMDSRWRAIREDKSPFPGQEHPAMVVLRTGKPTFNTLMGIHKPTGELTWIMVNGVPIQNPQPLAEGAAAVVCSFHDVTPALELNERLRNSVREKEVMLQEIHHRVKNNLAITISLFNFQMRELNDGPGREALLQAQDRVRTMALVHEMLYQAPSFSQVDLPGYISQLVRHLAAGYAVDHRVRVDLQIHPVSLPLEAAIPFGLILNEVVSNAFKYAFPNDRQGTLTVALRKEETIVLEVSDDGQGLPAGLNLAETRSMGLRLVRELATQLDGAVEITAGAGTTFRLMIPTGLSVMP